MKKNSFIFDNFQYVSSTLNFNNGGYEKARKNYIRSFYKSLSKIETNLNEYSLLSPLTYFDNRTRGRTSKGVKEQIRTMERIVDDETRNKGQRRLGEKRESAGWSQLHYAYDRWKAIQEAIGRRWRYATPLN